MQEENAKKSTEEEISENDVIEADASGDKPAEAAEDEEVKSEAAETGITETETSRTEDASESPGVQDNSAKRSDFLKCVAGLYLIYTAYELGSSYLKNEEGSSLGFCVAGIIFGIIGVFLLYIVIRDFLRENRDKKAESADRMERQDKEP